MCRFLSGCQSVIHPTGAGREWGRWQSTQCLSQRDRVAQPRHSHSLAHSAGSPGRRFAAKTTSYTKQHNIAPYYDFYKTCPICQYASDLILLYCMSMESVLPIAAAALAAYPPLPLTIILYFAHVLLIAFVIMALAQEVEHWDSTIAIETKVTR